MTQAHSTFSMLDRLSRAQSARRSYVDILFSGFDSAISDGLLSLLRSAGLSPRGHVIHNKLELLEALSERSWDLVFSQASNRSQLSPADIVTCLLEESREISVIQLEADPSSDDQHVAIQQGIAFLLPEHANDLITARTVQLFEHQKERRRLHQLELALEQLSKQNQRLAEDSTLAVATLKDQHLVKANASFEALFQLNPDSENALPLNRIFTSESLLLVESALKNASGSLTESLTLKDKQGEEFSAQVELYPSAPDQPGVRALIVDPISLSVKTSQPQSDRREVLDEAAFMHALETQIQRASGGGQDAFLLYFNLSTNPASSDERLLAELRVTLKRKLTRLSQKHQIGLLDNLDIAILINNSERGIAKSFAQTIQAKLDTQELKLPTGIASLALGVGISPINDSSPTAAELILRAETSVRSIGQGSSNNAFTNPVQHQLEIDRATKALEDAIANHHLRLLYQPLVSLNEANVERSYEILVRMSDGANADKLPAQFLSSLEHARVMVKLDRWVVEKSLFELQRQIGPQRELRIYINLARRTLKSSSFAPWVSNLMDELGLSGEFIVFEMSESDAAADLESTQSLCDQLRVRGIGICVKHFGCSTSSYKVYSRLQPNFIKIDGAFIEELENSERGFKAINRLLTTVDRQQTKVIAPLIEDAAMLPELYRMGFDLVQGYYLQPPHEEMRYEYFD